jgi:hypothetical protein
VQLLVPGRASHYFATHINFNFRRSEADREAHMSVYDSGGPGVQVWDFFISFFHKELRSPEMLAHHSLAAMLCYWALTMPYMHYYAVYFM